MEDTERAVGDVINRPYFRLAFIVVCLMLLTFVAVKEGFSLAVLVDMLRQKKTERLADQAAINAFYPSTTPGKGAQRQFANWVGAYNL